MEQKEDEDDMELARALAMSLEGRITSVQQEETTTSEAISSSALAEEWYPNLDHIQVLLSMGMSENAAKRGLYHTSNVSADLAAAWIFDNLDDPLLHEPFSPPPRSADAQASLSESRELKMVFVINSALRMGAGKIAAQVGHATLALYKVLLVNLGEKGSVQEWEDRGAKKIVLKGSGEEELLALKEVAKAQGISHYIVKDAGKTQVLPGSVTVLALFGKGYVVDEITVLISVCFFKNNYLSLRGCGV